MKILPTMVVLGVVVLFGAAIINKAHAATPVVVVNPSDLKPDSECPHSKIHYTDTAPVIQDNHIHIKHGDIIYEDDVTDADVLDMDDIDQ